MTHDQETHHPDCPANNEGACKCFEIEHGFTTGDRFIIITPTIFTGDIPAYFEAEEDGPDIPCTYATEREAAIEMLEDKIASLESQLVELKAGNITGDEIDYGQEDFIVPCTVHPDGTITTETHNPLYDPKTYVR